jgi:VanZ family protein
LKATVNGKMSLMTLRIIFIRWLPAIFIMGLIFFFSSLPSTRIPYYGAFDIILKKGGHALGYGLLSLSYYYALPGSLSRFYRWIIAFIMAILFALSDEYHQSFVQGRDSSIGDVAIDGLGAAVALFLGAGYSSNSRSNSSP